MGLTDWKLLTVAGNEGFKQACRNEKDSRFFWVQDWGWMTDEIIKTQNELLDLRNDRKVERMRRYEDEEDENPEGLIRFVDPCPYYPMSTNHEYGWLLRPKPQVCQDLWTIENFGPFPLYPKKARKEFTESEIREAIIQLKKRRRMLK